MMRDTAEIQKRAALVLDGADLDLSWEDAGYATALDAARALVGDSGEPDFDEAAARLVATEID